MYLKTLGRIAGVGVLAAMLTGCMDVDSTIEVQSETTGKATANITIGAEFYPMIKQMQQADTESTEDAFCNKEGDTLTENADGSATCSTVMEGEFAKLTGGDGPNEDASFTVVSPGVVRVAFKTEDMSSTVKDGQDAEAMAMLTPYLEGHAATIRIKGKKITDTNMTLSADGTSAETSIKLLDLVNGTTNLPAEIYAVVDTK